NIYNPTNGSFLGTPKDIFGIALDFDGLWSLFQDDGNVYFTAGIVDENHGIFGAIF
ncbi:MAG: PEP-CTERM sorting domain-containing protein, partial [Verrucomicrobia bacterium]